MFLSFVAGQISEQEEAGRAKTKSSRTICSTGAT